MKSRDQRRLFPESLNHSTSEPDLFGLPSNSSKNEPLDAPVGTLGSNLHELGDKQIRQLIRLKFNDDAILLIRQLSQDLTSKEQELVLLRKQHFIREQELLRLCYEYGNLSSLEVDQKLNHLPVEQDVDRALSSMIEDALQEDLGDKKSPVLKDLSATLEVPKTSPQTRPKPQKSSSWLNNWFHDTKLSKSTSSLPETNVVSLIGRIKSPSKEMESDQITRAPVELSTMESHESSISKVPNVNTDKYGFYNDVEASKPSVPKTYKSETRHSEVTENKASLMVNELDIIGVTNTTLKQPSIDKLKELGELHDAKNLQFEHQWDVFFKRLLKDHYRKLDTEELSNVEMFGVKGLKLIKLDHTNETDSEEDNYKHYETLMKLVGQQGIPLKFRKTLWLELLGASNLKVAGEYQRLVDISMNGQDATIRKNTDQIDLDLHRTLPSNIYFNDVANSQPGPNFYRLKRILYAFAAYKPNIGYSQGMNKIIGNLLLGLIDDEKSEEYVFWIFVAVTEQILPTYRDQGKTYNYFDAACLKCIQQDQKIMTGVFFPRVMPKLHHHLVQTLDVQLEFVTISWWLSVFTENFLNLEIWFKIFDNLLLSEHTDLRLMCLSLSTFKLLEKPLLSATSSDEVYSIMKNLNHNGWTRMNLRFSELSKICSHIERKLNMADLRKQRQKLDGVPW